MRWRPVLANFASGVAALLGAILALILAMDLLGDPASFQMPMESDEAARAAFRAEHGLDRPLAVRAIAQLANLASGAFGQSQWLRRPVADVVREHLPATLALAALAMPAGLAGGIALGLLLGLAPRSPWPRRLRGVLMAGFAVPGFVVAIVAIQVVAVDLRLLPASGFDSWSALVLPALLLAAGFAVRLGLLLQDRLNALASQPFVRFAAAKGLAHAVVVRRHLLRPAASLALGYASLQLGYLIGGALVVETVFAIPGLGRLAVLALANRDLPLLQACLVVAGSGFLVVRLIADLAHAAIDPRPSLAAGA